MEEQNNQNFENQEAEANESVEVSKTKEKKPLPKKVKMAIIIGAAIAVIAIAVVLIILFGGKNNTDSPTHTHTFGEWENTKDATCTETGEKMRVCECGYEETSTIEIKTHNFNNGVCSLCDYINPTEASRQLSIVSNIYSDLKTLEKKCDNLSTIYYKAWYFVIWEAEDYYNFEELLYDFTSYTGLSTEKTLIAIMEYCESIGMDGSYKSGLAVLRTTSATLYVVERALELSGTLTSCENLVSEITDDLKTVNGKVIDNAITTALENYTNAVLNYYFFAKSPSGSFNSYSSSMTTYQTTCATYNTALSLLIN